MKSSSDRTGVRSQKSQKSQKSHKSRMSSEKPGLASDRIDEEYDDDEFDD